MILPWRRPLLRLLLALIALYAALCVLVFLFQHKLLFFPGPAPSRNPSDDGLEYREVLLKTSDGEGLHAWWIEAPDARGAVVFSHGNAGNMEGRLWGAEAFRNMGLSVLLYDYRGYGNSTGTPSEEGLYLDAEAAYDFVTGEGGVPADKVISYGESLGGAVAVELARRRTVGALITEATFTSLPDMASDVYPFLPARRLSRFEFDSLSKVSDLTVPHLVLHSPSDNLVPFTHAQRLFKAAGSSCTLIRTLGGHNNGGFLQDRALRKEVEQFVDRAVGVLAEAAAR